VLAALDAHAGEAIPDADRIRELARAGAENPKLGSVLRAEPTPTARASCQACREKIEKGKLRIALEREAEPGSMASTSFIHLACAPEHLGTAGLLDKLLRTSPDLDAEQIAELKSALG
jgi:hypothetical protein